MTIDLLFPTAESAIDDERILELYDRPPDAGTWVRANFVSSVDGAATSGGKSAGLGSDADHRVFELLRTLCDVVLLGAGTMRDEGYGPMRLDAAAEHSRAARGLTPQPAFAIVSGRLDLDPESPVFADAPVRPIVFTTGASSAAARERLAPVADVVVTGETELDVATLLAELHSRGLGRIHCEGGPALFATLLAAGAVDELCITIAPLLEGGAAPRIATSPAEVHQGMGLAHVLLGDGSLILRYVR
ncbi:MAG: pyrimidine reductase family protein [Rhodoglobus sp.]